MLLSELFGELDFALKDGVMPFEETARNVWSRRGDKRIKQTKTITGSMAEVSKTRFVFKKGARRKKL